MNKCTCQAEIHSSENMCSNCLHELHQEIKEYEDSMQWIHQYAYYLNTLVNEYRKYGEVTDLGISQAEDLIECLPGYNLVKERDRENTYIVYNY